MALGGILGSLASVAYALETVEAEYLVGGSIASSLQGVPRSTQDVDLLADLTPSQVPSFVEALGRAFYADDLRIADGVARRSSFNLIDQGNGFKVDVYLYRDEPFDRSQFARRRRYEIAEGVELPFASAEDVVLQKLRWYRLGGEVAERQWLDALGVLEVQEGRLDLDYLVRWAADLGVSDLLDRALASASGEG